jgi:hypothetical protein
VLPVQSVAAGVLAEIIRRQPASKERTAFAWSVAVGPALARVSRVELEGTTLRVRVADERWQLELERARPTILPRLRAFLGADAIASMVILDTRTAYSYSTHA